MTEEKKQDLGIDYKVKYTLENVSKVAKEFGEKATRNYELFGRASAAAYERDFTSAIIIYENLLTKMRITKNCRERLAKFDELFITEKFDQTLNTQLSYNYNLLARIMDAASAEMVSFQKWTYDCPGVMKEVIKFWNECDHSDYDKALDGLTQYDNNFIVDFLAKVSKLSEFTQ